MADQFDPASMLQGAQGYGYFTPGGSNAFRTTARRRLLNQGRSRRNRASLLGKLAGLDAMGQRQQLVDTEQDIAGQTAGALNDFDFNQQQGDQDFFRGMLGRHQDFQRQRQLAEDERKAQDKGFWGDLAGTALGVVPWGGVAGGIAKGIGGLFGPKKPKGYGSGQYVTRR